jgi:hypothetical protein
MFFRHRAGAQIGGLLGLLAFFVVAGCSRMQSADQALAKSLEVSGRQRMAVFPLAGKVTVDGVPAQLKPGERIIVMLNDVSKPDLPLIQRPHVPVRETGEFKFRTYEEADGVPPGTYVLTFAEFKVDKKRGFLGPDGFHNLYNDPERNKQEYPELQINHQSPGESHYEFNLRIAGRDEVAAAKGALTDLQFEGTRRKHR